MHYQLKYKEQSKVSESAVPNVQFGDSVEDQGNDRNGDTESIEKVHCRFIRLLEWSSIGEVAAGILSDGSALGDVGRGGPIIALSIDASDSADHASAV